VKINTEGEIAPFLNPFSQKTSNQNFEMGTWFSIFESSVSYAFGGHMTPAAPRKRDVSDAMCPWFKCKLAFVIGKYMQIFLPHYGSSPTLLFYLAKTGVCFSSVVF